MNGTVRKERKLVTVLFADLVGFTARAESLDPEDVEALLAPYHRHLREELERFGGTVEKFIGDAVVAVFGAPVAHEDAPERAVRAALAIRDWAREQPGLELRIAVNTGEALVTLDADPARGEGMVAGDVVNTAARLQAAAPANGVLAGEATYRATERAIAYLEAEAVDAKGKAAPVAAWEAVEPRSRLGVDPRRGAPAPLVGRARELDELLGALRRVQDERSPQLVTLVGVPGIGKTRLVHELFDGVEREPEPITWRQGRSLPYGESVAYRALGEIVKVQAGILETDAPADAERKLADTLADLVTETSDAAWVARHVRPLLGLDADVEEGGVDRRSEAFAAWRRFLDALAAQRPLVLVFEDLHFADDGLLDFVDELVDWADGVPLLVVGTARPELLARRPSWAGGKANARTLSLAPLSDEETAVVVHGVLGRAGLAADVQTALVKRAAGNPLYAEEFARLVGDGLDATGVPHSVQGIIAARLDALPAEEKALLQDAAVVGEVFWAGALAGEPTQLGSHLHALQRKEFVRRERESSVAGDTEYAFRHALIRDVAYEQIPRAGRAAKHEAVAAWVESLGRAEEHAELLVHHYVAALDLSRAAGRDTAEIEPRAAAALRLAGDRAGALSSFPAAEAFYSRALELLPHDDPARPGLLVSRARARVAAGHEAGLSSLEEARDAALDAGDLELTASAETLLARALWYRGVTASARARVDAAVELVRDASPSAAKAGALAESARQHMVAGDLDRAVAVARDALAIAEVLALDHLRADLLVTVGTARFLAGDLEGRDDVDRAHELGLAAGDLRSAARAAHSSAGMSYQHGRLETAFALTRKALTLHQHLGEQDAVVTGRAMTASEAYHKGRWNECLSIADAVIARAEVEPHRMEGIMRVEFRAPVRLARDDRVGAVDDVRRGLAAARQGEAPDVVLLSAAVLVLVEVGDVEEAATLADDLVALASDVRPPANWLIDFAWVAAGLGRDAELRAILSAAPVQTLWVAAAVALLDGRDGDAAQLFAEMGTLPHEARARLRAAEQLLRRGRRAEADAQLEPALAFWRSVGATRYTREGEQLLAATA